MARVAMGVILRDLRNLARAPGTEELTDQELLQAFTQKHDEAAFAGLVRRHGPMVLRVCRDVLAHEQDAEDAFQATFLVLARQCASIRKQQSLASWLHGVAYRTAMHAKRTAGRRRTHERRAVPAQPQDPAGELSWREVQAALDQEIQRLPEKLRAPFVLCVLEGRRSMEVARELHLKEGTVWSRLAEARNQLQKRLTRRGLALSMVVAAVTVSLGSASALVPASLVHSTVQGVSLLATGAVGVGGQVSATALALAQGMGKDMLRTRLTIGIACLTLAGTIALGAGLMTRDRLEAPPSEDRLPEAPKPREAKGGNDRTAGVAAVEETRDAVTLSARVLDPDGKPFVGAEIALGWWQPFGRDWFPWIVSPFLPKNGATTGPDGRFRMTMTKAEIFAAVDSPRNKPWRFFQIVASAKGYGPGFVTLEPGQKDVTIRLARDDVPVLGRVLDLQGRPVAGATVRVDHLTGGDRSERILFVNSWPGLPPKVTTDREGRFTLRNLGRGRTVLLHLEGPTIEHKLVTVSTRARGEKPEGARVEIIAGPTKPIKGVVRDRDTGKPLAGIVVYGNREAHRGGVRAVTDEAGRYELVGLPKARVYELDVFPSSGRPYLELTRQVGDTEGLKPLQVDFQLRRGVPVRLSVIDKVTRQPVRGVVRYSPLLDNPLHSEARRPASNWASDILHMPDKDHCYHFIAFPGPGIIYAWVGGDTYLPARFSLDPADEKKGYTLRNGKDPLALGWLTLLEGYRIIDPPSTDKSLSVQIELDPGRTVKGALLGPDSRPVTGALAFGLNHNPKYEHGVYGPPHGDQTLPSDAFLARSLHPSQPRCVTFVHKERKLIGHVVLRGDEKEPVAVRLQPWGVMTGRLVDAGGKPLAGVGVQWRYPSLPAPGPRPAVPASTTDAEGRFRLEGLLPGPRFGLSLTDKKPVVLSAEALRGLSLQPGETRDLGDIRVHAAPVKKQTGGSDE